MLGKRILLVGAHADDVELNAGGSIHKWRSEGRDVAIAILASHDSQVRHEEVELAGMHLGVNQIYSLGGKDTSLHDGFNHLLARLEELLLRFEADTVMTHFHADTHQDHATTYRIAIAAARKVSNFLMFKPTYPSGRPDIPFQPNVVSILSKTDMDAKLRAINAFESQRAKYGGDSWAQSMLAVSQGDAWTYGGLHGYAELFQLGRLRL
jgi:LmbE family N-acetylglucosaminyl deacetylase